MARLSKTPFTIYDEGVSATQASREEYTGQVHEEDEREQEGVKGVSDYEDGYDGLEPNDNPEAYQQQDHPYEDEEDPDMTAIEDDIRRISTQTRATVSTLPESDYETEPEQHTDNPGSQASKCYTPPIMRPSFRRPASVQRMQMASPPPFDRHSSPRHSSMLRHGGSSRTSTPRSVRSARGRAGETRSSPRPPPVTQAALESESELDDDSSKKAKETSLPLVLLHVTLLPVSLPWSVESMRQLLPRRVWENLQLLRSKAGDTVVQRGVLIPHPREEYELLEERLLEALELKAERVTKCGHFRGGRESVDSAESGRSAAGDSDSGVGSSVSGSDGGLGVCVTCRCRVKLEASAVGSGRGKWCVRVFAANGLMRAAAWAAAWNEMERVDVEILPWISEEVRKKLDERREEEDAEDRRRREGEGEKVKSLVEEQVRLQYESRRLEDQRRHLRAVSSSAHAAQQATWHPAAQPSPKQQRQQQPAAQSLDPSLPLAESHTEEASHSSELPRIYKPSQIPLSLLLKNYILLQLKDRRIVAMLFCGLLAILFALRGAVISTDELMFPDTMTVGDELSPSLSVATASGVFNGSSDVQMLSLRDDGSAELVSGSVDVPVETEFSPSPSPATAASSSETIDASVETPTMSPQEEPSLSVSDIAESLAETLGMADRTVPSSSPSPMAASTELHANSPPMPSSPAKTTELLFNRINMPAETCVAQFSVERKDG